jgi:hypothetical protein
MALVQIIGDKNVLRELAAVPDLNIVQSSAHPYGEGLWKVAAYSSDQAIEAARALGAEVQVLMSTEAHAEHRRDVAHAIMQQRAARREDD